MTIYIELIFFIYKVIKSMQEGQSQSKEAKDIVATERMTQN